MTKKSSFSAAFTELETLTSWFESESFDLDEGLKKFEKVLELAALCKGRLSEVENKIIELKAKYDEPQS